jgi:hypothetical protein
MIDRARMVALGRLVKDVVHETTRVRPFVAARHHRVFAGPGVVGVKGGLFNPSVFSHEGELFVIARGEHLPPTVVSPEKPEFLASGVPVLFRLDRHLGVCDVRRMKVEGIDPSAERIEDLRAFQTASGPLVVHATLDCRDLDSRGGRPQWTLETRQHIARIDVVRGTLERVARPSADFPLAHREKNWIFFELEGRLFVLYSFDPFHVLEVTERATFAMRTHLKVDLVLPRMLTAPPFGRTSFSTNPVEFDEGHDAIVVHRRDTRNVYAQWLVLLDRSTLLPTHVSSRPLFRGRPFFRRRGDGIVYTSAILRQGDEIVFFSGLRDRESAYCRVGRSVLRSWLVPLERPAHTTLVDARAVPA